MIVQNNNIEKNEPNSAGWNWGVLYICLNHQVWVIFNSNFGICFFLHNWKNIPSSSYAYTDGKLKNSGKVRFLWQKKKQKEKTPPY